MVRILAYFECTQLNMQNFLAKPSLSIAVIPKRIKLSIQENEGDKLLRKSKLLNVTFLSYEKCNNLFVSLVFA